MESSSIQISGGNPIFQGPITINVYNGESRKKNISPARQDEDSEKSVKGKGLEESDYSKPITKAKKKDFLDHAAKQQEFYQISSYPKGRVLIVNNEFRGDNDERRGSDKDLYDMCHLWKNMGCSLTVETDLTADNLLLRVEEFAAQQERSDICVVIIMSHGKGDDMIVGSKKGILEVKKIVECITSSPSLKAKPKLIFFQMCRGSNVQKTHVDAGGFYTDGSTWINDMLREVLPNGKILGSEQTEIDVPAKEYVSPTNDVMIAFATQPDSVSFRETQKGSWFIQSIRKVFTDNAAKHDVRTLMSKVKDDLKKKIVYEPGTDLHEGLVTMDGCDSFGKKRLMLFPGFPTSQEE